MPPQHVANGRRRRLLRAPNQTEPAAAAEPEPKTEPDPDRKTCERRIKNFWQSNNSCAYKLPPRANKPENQDKKQSTSTAKKEQRIKHKQSKHETEKQRKTFNRRRRLTNMMSRMVEHRTKAADRKCIKTITVNWPVRSLHKSIIALCRSMMPTSRLRISAFIDGLHTSTKQEKERQRERGSCGEWSCILSAEDY